MLVLMLAVAGVVLLPETAQGEGGWGKTVCPTGPDGKPAAGCTTTVGTPGRAGKPGSGSGSSAGRDGCRNPSGQVIPCQRNGGWAGRDGCYYEYLGRSNDFLSAMGAFPRPGPGAWYLRACYRDDSGGTQALGELVWLATPPAVSPAALAQQARDSLVLPEVRIQLNPTGEQLTYLPTWLSVHPSSWQPQSATASVPGVSVTATARPVRATWSMGDGSIVVCHGPGTAWPPGMDPAAVSPDCGHTYTRGSASMPDAAFPVRVTVSWVVTWAEAGQSGTIAGLASTATVRVRVAESQTVITRQDRVA